MESYLESVQPPGFYIREELEARGWIQRDLAFVLGVPEQAVNLILAGKRSITPEMALALGDAFDVNPELFINLQKTYDMARARRPDPGVARKGKLQSVYPIREMIKRVWLEDSDAAMLEAQLMRFLGVSHVDELVNPASAFKKTNHAEAATPTQLVWLYRVRQIAREMIVPTYSRDKLEAALTHIRRYMIDPEEIRHVPRTLAEAGVRLVIVEALPGSKIDGACTWLDSDSPVIGLSLRLDRIDNYWFVLRHEIEHVLQLHGMGNNDIIDVDMDDDTGISAEERIANEAAENFCVPIDMMASFIRRKSPFFSERDLLGLAQRAQVHPGIVAGQLRKKTERWNLFSKYLVKIKQYATMGAVVDGWGEVAPVSL
jgi:HTH-type transcriptional regulator/antitoxin HigA